MKDIRAHQNPTRSPHRDAQRERIRSNSFLLICARKHTDSAMCNVIGRLLCGIRDTRRRAHEKRRTGLPCLTVASAILPGDTCAEFDLEAGRLQEIRCRRPRVGVLQYVAAVVCADRAFEFSMTLMSSLVCHVPE